MKTIQLKIIKVAKKVKVMKTKVRVELPAEFYSKWAFEKCFRIFEALQIYSLMLIPSSFTYCNK
jgi:hypothetical protein